jgi:hypothetical protein
MKKVRIKIKGESAMLQHNATLANPMHPLTKEHKKVSAKRSKTDEDLMFLAKSEWKSSLYYSEQKGYYIPAEMLEACIRNAAKKQRLGKAVQQGLLITNAPELIFKDNSLTPDELYELTEYVDMRAVVVQRARIMRCRPIIDNWSVKFDIHFDEDVLSMGDIENFLEIAGKYIGIGDYRPRYGRFSHQIYSRN